MCLSLTCDQSSIVISCTDMELNVQDDWCVYTDHHLGFYWGYFWDKQDTYYNASFHSIPGLVYEKVGPKLNNIHIETAGNY